MNNQGLLVTALAGFASAALFLAGPASALMAVLQIFTQLPLLFCGLTLGLKPMLLASAVSALVITGVGGYLTTLVFAATFAAPCLLLVRQWLLSRNDDQGNTEWFPVGWVAAQLAIYFFVLATLIILILESQSVDITGTIREAFEAFAASVALPEGQAIDMTLVDRLARLVPAFTAVGLLVSTLLNALVAQSLAVRSGQARRPTPLFSSLSLPNWAILGLAATTVASFVLSGTMFLIAAVAMLLMMALFFFQGLAVVHAYMQPRSWRGPGLFLFYVLLLFLGWVAFFVVVLGLIEDRLHLRHRFT